MPQREELSRAVRGRVEHIGSRGALDIEALGEVSAAALTHPAVPDVPPLPTEAPLFDLTVAELFPIEVVVRDIETGFYVAPTLIADAKPEMRVVQEEIFGPVVVVLPFDEEDEAVALANGTDFGLNDYVFTADTAKAMRVARQLRSGSVALNTAQQSPEAPFGGFKRSGVGRDRGSFALHAYSELQSIVWPG